MAEAATTDNKPAGRVLLGFQAKVLLLVCGVLLLSQTVFFAVYDRTSSQSIRSVILADLDTTRSVFKRILDDRFDRLTELVQVLSYDFGFRSAIALSEKATIDSALENHMQRIGADAMFAFNTQGELITAYPPMPAGSVMTSFKNIFSGPGIEERIGKRFLTMVLLEGKPYQVVIVPVKAPQLVAFTAIGFVLPREFAEEIKKMSGVEVSFLVQDGNEMKVLVSTNIREGGADELIRQLGVHSEQENLFPVLLDGEEHMTSRVPLFDLGSQNFFALMQSSLTQAQEPYIRHRKFMMMLALVFLAGTIPIGLLLSRQVVRPIKALGEAVKKVEKGNYSDKLAVGRQDQIGMLISGFNQMLDGLTVARNDLAKALQDATRAKEAAEKASMAKSEFLAAMSHELRTPMNSILGMTSIMMEDRAVAPESRKLLEVVKKSGTSLLALIDDVLDISKIEADGMQLEATPFDIKTVMNDCLAAIGPMARTKGIILRAEFPHDFPRFVGDPLRIQRIFMNLLGNAVKYTEKGRISLIAGYKNLEEGKIRFHCAVEDTGIGIPEDRHESIFEKFVQADLSTTRKYGGTGLGLAITKALVHMMEGTITVTSKPGEGSVFRFEIPFAAADESTVKEKRKPAWQRKTVANPAAIPAERARILVAEDHEMNQEFMITTLQRLGIGHFDIEVNGALAYEAYMDKDYDIILMDCHMPEQNGWETTIRLRNSGKEGSADIPVIALTADAMPGTREKCLEAGMNEYITKPVEPAYLREVLSRWIAFKDVEEAGAAPLAEKKAQSASLDLLKKYGSTPGAMNKIVDLFKLTVDKSLAILESNCVDGPCKEWVGAAHKLKGSAGMVGAEKLYELGANAQMMEDAEQDKRREAFEAMKREYKKVAAEMDRLLAA